jgi:hypothetical protein
MIASTIIYLSPILDIKLDSRDKAELMEYLIEKIGYQEGDNFKTVKIKNCDDIYYRWKDEATLVLTNNIMSLPNLEYYPKYKW